MDPAAAMSFAAGSSTPKQVVCCLLHDYGHLTEILIFLFMPPQVIVIVAVPFFNALTLPVFETFATFGLLLLKVTLPAAPYTLSLMLLPFFNVTLLFFIPLVVTVNVAGPLCDDVSDVDEAGEGLLCGAAPVEAAHTVLSSVSGLAC